ncbi:hypothetical protein ACGFJ7_27875 [Actinoplanes sp. NPDC048988]|uniref:hypothetical protein n=1 Tax=Actinoplanes sp. NPDC048988 TaxID=3363901 RepID=UPI003716868C
MEDGKIFLRDLRQTVVASGKTQIQISKSSNIPQSTLSDIILGKQARLPGKAILAGLLQACGLTGEEIEEWEQRRVDIVTKHSDSGYTGTRDDVEHLAAKLTEATARFEALKTQEEKLRADLRQVEGERDGLATALRLEQARNDRSARDFSVVQGKIRSFERHVELLRRKVDDGIEQVRKAHLEAENLRADLERAQIELLYAGFQREQDQTEAPVNWAFDLRMEAARKGAYIEEARAFCRGALDALQNAGQEFVSSLRGTPGEEVRNRVRVQLMASSDELAQSLQAIGEFAILADGAHFPHDSLAFVGEQLRRCQEELAECEGELGRQRDRLSVIEGSLAYPDLAALLTQASTGIENCQNATAYALQILQDYR